MLIGISDSMSSPEKFGKYAKWVMNGRDDVAFVKLSYLLDNLEEAYRCQGIVLTGGSDVDPSLYGEQPHTATYGVDPKRDAFEGKILDFVLDADIPMLGICRGMQFANIHLGGTLIQDLPSAGLSGHNQNGESQRGHLIVVEPDSRLAEISLATQGSVNSYHHQSTAKPGRGLRVVARSPDGVPEAMEFERPESRSFFLLVQWHPERMSQPGSSFSTPVRDAFLASCQAPFIDRTSMMKGIP